MVCAASQSSAVAACEHIGVGGDIASNGSDTALLAAESTSMKPAKHPCCKIWRNTAVSTRQSWRCLPPMLIVTASVMHVGVGTVKVRSSVVPKQLIMWHSTAGGVKDLLYTASSSVNTTKTNSAYWLRLVGQASLTSVASQRGSNMPVLLVQLEYLFSPTRSVTSPAINMK